MNHMSMVVHRGAFFVKYQEYYDLCGEDWNKADAHRVLETKLNDRATVLRESGQPLTEENLWLTLTWEDFVKRSLHDAEQTSFRKVLPELEKDGYVKSRYVKLDDDNQPVRNKKGKVVWWETYQEARTDHDYQGIVVRQYLYLYEKVNKALARLWGEDRPDDDGPGGGEKGSTDDESNEGARGGNLQSASIDSSSVATSITQSTLSKTTGYGVSRTKSLSPETGGGENGEHTLSKTTDLPCRKEQEYPAKNDNNKNLSIESCEESEESSKISVAPDGAEVGLSSFFENALANALATPEESCWSREGIANLLAVFLAPLPAMRKEQRQKDEERWQQAIETIFLHMALSFEDKQKRPIIFSDLLQFVTRSNSPCKYRRWWMEHIGDINKLRPWHVADNLSRIYQDLLKSGWRPENAHREQSAESIAEELSQPNNPEPDREPEPTVTPEPEVEVGAPVGMDGAVAHEVARYIHQERPGYCVEIEKCAGGGYYLEVAAHVERVFRIVTQEDLDDFVERTRPRRWRDALADREARQQKLPKAS